MYENTKFYGSNEWNGKAEFHKFRAEWRKKTAKMRNNSAKSILCSFVTFVLEGRNMRLVRPSVRPSVPYDLQYKEA